MTPLLTRGAEGLDRRAFSLAEVEAMVAARVLDPDERFELIDGEIAPRPSQNMPHMLWKARLAKWFYARLAEPLVLVPEATVRLRDERPAVTLEADLVIFAPEPGAAAIRGPMVKLAIEIADASIARDQEVKAPRYARHGVAELWIVDVNARAVRRCRDPGSDGYGTVEEIPFDREIAPAFDPALAVRLADLG